jgi:hypothetical protein
MVREFGLGWWVIVSKSRLTIVYERPVAGEFA